MATQMVTSGAHTGIQFGMKQKSQQNKTERRKNANGKPYHNAVNAMDRVGLHGIGYGQHVAAENGRTHRIITISQSILNIKNATR